MRVLVKILGTLGVVALLGWPLWAPQWGSGVLGDIAALPPAVTVCVAGGFLGLVAVYCRTLQQTLTLVGAGARTADPASVWWMFAVPYNFVEDFFIVRAVGASLAAGGHMAPSELRRWSRLGYGWCGLQVLSLLPGLVGFAAGGAALAVWAAHWTMTVRMNRRLAHHPSGIGLACG